MRATLPEDLPLVCPACRTRDERGWRMATLDVAKQLRGDGVELHEAILACRGCKRRYPVRDGVPIVLADFPAYARADATLLVEADLPPELQALFVEGGPDTDPYPRLTEQVSIYADAHWGDRAKPPPDGPGGGPGGGPGAAPGFGFAAIADKLAARAEAKVERAVELGCGFGRGLAELARGARQVVGLDLNFGTLRRARRILRGEGLSYARRIAGRSYGRADIPKGPRAPVVEVVCGDALDPPFAPGTFQRVAALNLVDAVSDPAGVLAVADGLCAPGGELLFASPYAWQSGIVDEDARLGGADPAGHLRSLLERGEGLSSAYRIEDEAELRWWLRRDARNAVIYDVHWLRARKSG